MTKLIAILTGVSLVLCGCAGSGTSTSTGLDQQTISAIEAMALQYATSGTFDQSTAVTAIQQQFPGVNSSQISTIVAGQFAKAKKKPTPAPKPKPTSTPKKT